MQLPHEMVILHMTNAPSLIQARKGAGVVDLAQSLKAGTGGEFEKCVEGVLALHDVRPVTPQVKLAYKTNWDYDLLLRLDDPTPPAPRYIGMALKASLAERWRQETDAGAYLMDTFPPSEMYVLTLSANAKTQRAANEADRADAAIRQGQTRGITGIIRADQPEFDDFVKRLAGFKYKELGPEDIFRFNEKSVRRFL